MARMIDLETAAALVPDGATIGITGGAPPMALYLALIRRGARNLTLVTAPAGGFDVDLLVGAGCVSVVETSGISLGEHGLSPNFDRAVRNGSITVRDTT
jgi:glutaconate CoA-transferase, subunit A